MSSSRSSLVQPDRSQIKNAGGAALEPLEPLAIFGFDGKIAGALHVHPDGKHVLFPLGNKVSILHVDTKHQQFLSGHTNTVSTLDVSKTGTLIASGQINNMGFRAYVIVWSWETRAELFRHEMHKVRVQTLCFTSNELCLISLGGSDDGMVIVWDIIKNAAICGARATSEIMGEATQAKCLQRRGSDFFTGGDQNLRIWCIDCDQHKLTFDDVIVGKLRRQFTSMSVNAIDEIMYAGTMSGDVAKIRLNCHYDPSVLTREKSPILLGVFGRHNAKKPPGKDCEKYANGVRALLIVSKERLIIGAGDGTVEMVVERDAKFTNEYPSPTWPQFKMLKRTKVNGSVSSIQQLDPDTIIVGTELCEIYTIHLATFQLKLLLTCNTSTVYDIAFPKNYSKVFATASHQSVRVWSATKKQELLRITVPNVTAAAIVFTSDGKSIVSAWNDGVIRAFTPLTGKLIYHIPNAHNKGCSALAVSHCNRYLVSGGIEGQVRLWQIEPTRQSLIGVLKEHRGTIGSVDFNVFNTEVVSASSDGTCIIWDVRRMTRKSVLYANTQFSCAKYYPSGVQIIATGTDKRVSWWEVYDASMVRDVEASARGPVNCLALNGTGEYFVSAGSDQLVKLWNYQTGVPVALGTGHAGVIVTCAYSPCGRFLVTGSADGAVFIWKVPETCWYKQTGDAQQDVQQSNELLSAKSGGSLKSSGTNSIGKLSVKSSASTKSSANCSVGIKSSMTGRGIGRSGPPEIIQKLESSRSNREAHICECPEIDATGATDVNEQCVYVEQE